MGFSLRGRRAGAPAQPPRPVEATEVSDNEATRVGVYLFALALFAVGAGVATGAWMAVVGSVGALTAVVAVLVGLALAGAVRVAPQWERVAILRLGRFHRIAGPGPYVVAPLVDYAAMHVDTRVMNSSFAAEAALTALARRLKAPRLIEDPPPYRPGAALRGPEHLRVAIDGIA